MISQRNIPIVEINIETTPSTSLAKFILEKIFLDEKVFLFRYHFHASAAQILPQLLNEDLHQDKN